jgi:polysaccharide export outer membrane protein
MISAMLHSRPLVQRVKLILAASILMVLTMPAKSEPHLDAGDTLDVSVAGIPELNKRIMIQPDGSISFPLLGTIPVAGLLPSEARAKIQAGLAAKVFRMVGPNGEQSNIVIDPDQVTATVAEFRPVIVNGDITKPGEQKWRPSMTVREVVALAGGYDMLHSHLGAGGNPFLLSSDLRADYEAQWTDFIKEQAAIWRIQSELGHRANFDQTMLTKAPLPRSTIAEIVGLESEQLQVHQTDLERKKSLIQNLMKQTDDHIKIVSDELKLDDDAVTQDTNDLNNLSSLFDKKVISNIRMADARKALLLSSTRKLGAQSELLKLKESGLELSERLEELTSKRKDDLLKELSDRNVRLSQIRSKLRSIDEKMQYTGIIRSQLMQGKGVEPELVVVRNRGDGRQLIHVDEDYEVEPGDVVEVTLRQGSTDASASAK